MSVIAVKKENIMPTFLNYILFLLSNEKHLSRNLYNVLFLILNVLYYSEYERNKYSVIEMFTFLFFSNIFSSWPLIVRKFHFFDTAEL